MKVENPTTVQGYCQAARQALAQGEVNHALQLLQEAIRAEPRNADVYRLLGIAYAQKGGYEDGINALHLALEQNASHAPTRYNLAMMLQQVGRLRQAASELEEALQIDPTYERARVALAALQAQLPPEANASASEAAADPEALTKRHHCIHHPNAMATDHCRKCESLLCDDCTRMDYGTVYCPRCYDEVVQARERIAQERRDASAVAAAAEAEEKSKGGWLGRWRKR